MKTGKIFVIITFIVVFSFSLTACDEFELLFNNETYKHRHNWEVFSDPSTCSYEGMEYKFCMGCFEMTNETIIPIDPNNHLSCYVKETVNPTCTGTGRGLEICWECNASKEVDVPPWGHFWGNLTELVPPTCTTAGKGRDNCLECGFEYPEEIILFELGHSWNMQSTRLEPTCTVPGKIEEPCVREDCSSVKEQIIPKLGHNRQKKTIVAARCLTDGTGEEYCVRVGCTDPDIVELVFPMLGHSVSTVATRAATCETDGYGQTKCINNGCTYIEDANVILYKLYHNIVTISQNVPLPCVSGQPLIDDCTRSGCSYRKEYKVSVDHKWVNNSLGLGRTCSVCKLPTF